MEVRMKSYADVVNMSIKAYDDRFRDDMISLWERSVRATHHFLDPVDIDYFKTVVKGIDFRAFQVYCLVVGERLVGFLGVADKKIEMLFLDPQFIGQGLGKKLMDFALNELKAQEVDVNEQNENAVRFYSKFGFRTYDRSEKDSEGKEYPILKMRLEED